MARFRSVKKTWKARPKVLTPLQKKEVKSIIKRTAIDYKTRFGVIPATPNATPNLLTLASSFDVSNISRYDSGSTLKDTCRTGDRIKISSIRLYGVLREYGTLSTIRVMMVYHKANDGSLTNPNQVIQNNIASWSTHSLHEHNCPYTILYDRKFSLDYTKNSYELDTVLRFKKPLIVEYDPAATGGLPIDIVSGSISLFVAADTTAPGANPHDWLTTSVNFYDF